MGPEINGWCSCEEQQRFEDTEETDMEKVTRRQRQRLELCCYKPKTPVIGTNHWKLEEAKKDASQRLWGEHDLTNTILVNVQPP